MEQLRQNVRYALRVLRKSPGFTAVAVVSLALGIGANAAIFTLVNALLLRDLPVRDPERLVELSISRLDGKGIPFSYPMFKEVERGQRVFSDLMGWSGARFTVEVNGVPSQNNILAVTGNYYSGLGVAPLFGRLLTAEDVNPRSGATPQVAVIGYQFWQQRLVNAPDVIGKQIRIEGRSFTIVVGIAIGIPCGLASSRLIAGMLFGVSSNDFSNIVTACPLLLAVALFAGYVPAHRASRIDPIVALRAE